VAGADFVANSDSRRSSVEQHVDLFRLDFHAVERVFVERLPLDSPRLVTPEGKPTQLAIGFATYFEVSDPHTMEDCAYA
jgi:hypothetical protein